MSFHRTPPGSSGHRVDKKQGERLLLEKKLERSHPRCDNCSSPFGNHVLSFRFCDKCGEPNPNYKNDGKRRVPCTDEDHVKHLTGSFKNRARLTNLINFCPDCGTRMSVPNPK